MEQPYHGRALLNETYDGLEIIIPTKKNWALITFLGVWLGGWAIGELVTIVAMLGFIGGHASSGNFFLLFWISGWTIGGLFAFKTFLWSLAGKEIINFSQGYLNVEKKNMLLSKPKMYDIKEMKRIRVLEENNNDAFWGTRNTLGSLNANGTIRFDYGMQTVKIAGAIDEVEANYILGKLKASRILTDANFS